MSPSDLLKAAFDAAVAAARPESWLAPALADLRPPKGVTRVVALGKSAIPMADAAGRALIGPVDGLAIAVGEPRPVSGFRVVAGAHPVPDETSLTAGEAALAFAAASGPDDRLLLLVSGGASAAACAPIPGVALGDKAALTRRLLASGADIAEINTVRRALSRLKGGGLARAARGEALTLAMSDVPDDALHDIGSGPGAPSPTGAEEALAVLRTHAPSFVPRLGPAMRAWGACADRSGGEGRVLLRIGDVLEAAAAVLVRAGWPVRNLGSLTGDVEATAEAHAALAARGRPLVLLSGGELTSVLPQRPGRGGRNTAYLLALARALAGRADVWALAADTDGVDGAAGAAGAMLLAGQIARLDPGAAGAALRRGDSAGFLDGLGALLHAGPTGVNAGDLRLVLVGPAPGA